VWLTVEEFRAYRNGETIFAPDSATAKFRVERLAMAIERVQEAQQHLAFREVFLVETGRGYSATLYGKQTPVRRRKSH